MTPDSKRRSIKSIAKSDSFGPVLKTRPVSRTNHLLLHQLAGQCPLKLGILAPKRLVKRAVDRHAIKRIIREVCRLELPDNMNGLLLVRLVKPVQSIPYSKRALWWKELRQLLKGL
jgi:ribonuclease P protein component